MDNPEEVMQILERFNCSRNPEINSQLNEYITFVARTGDSVYAWSLVKNLFREKLVTVITDFYNETPTKGKANPQKTSSSLESSPFPSLSISELPQYPNVDPFNYETMKKMLIEKLESFAAAPFTIQRISELLSDPRKQYSRIDKFMRAVEKTILVVSTVPPGRHRSESENGDSLDSALNGDFATEVNVDIEMEQDPSFAITKDEPKDEPAATSSCKEPNLKVESVETKTIKKNASPSKDEPGTSESVGVKLEIEETVKKSEASPESSSTIAEPTVIESLPEETSTAALETAAAEIKNQNDENLAKSDAALIQSSAEVPVMAVAEPKLDESLSNEPIRSADNEILVDTAEIISETTPLAALENIVAIRTDAAAAAADILEPVELQIAAPTVITSEPETNENREEVIVQTSAALRDDSDAKRLKLIEIPESVPEAEASTDSIAEDENITQDEQPIPEILEKSQEFIEVTPSEPFIVEPVVALPSTDEPEAVIAIAETIIDEKIDEPLPEIAEIPIEIVPSSDQNIVEAPLAEMETVPTAENKMSLDEDEPPALELEMTPITSKMDTDEAEANAPMDFEDDAEPMDQ